MLSTSAAKFQIDATKASGYSELDISVSTEIMQDHSAGMPIDPKQRIAVVRDSNNAPMVFSIGSDSGFYLIMRDPDNPAGWKQIDLRPGINKAYSYIGDKAKAQAMAVSQDANGTIRIAVALKAANTPGNNNILFLTRDLSNDASRTNWDDLSTKWVDRPDSLGGVRITGIKLGTNNDKIGPPTVLVIINVNGEEKHYFVNADFSDTSWMWEAYPIPHNADKILDVAVGTFGFRGTWALYTVGKEKVLTFTSIRSKQMPQPIDIIYENIPPNPVAIGTLPGANNNNTDLYVAGNGLYVYRTITPPKGSPKYITIVDGKTLPGAKELILSQAGSNVSIWAMDENETLVHIQGKNDKDNAWTTPVPLLSNVSQIAPLRDSQDQVNDVFIVTNDSKLEYMWRDQSNSLWSTQEIGVNSTGNMLTYKAYVTQIKVKANNGSQNIVKDPLKISSSYYGYVTINGRSHIISPEHEAAVVPDEMGIVKITNKIDDITAPVFHINADFLTTGFDVHPGAALNQKLHTMTADDLTRATFQFGSNRGQKVLQGEYAKPSRVQASAKVLKKITDLVLITFDNSGHAHMVNQGVKLNSSGKPDNKIDHGKLPDGYAWGFTWDGTSLNFSDGPHAIESIGKILEKNPMTWFIGDVLEHFGEKLEEKPKSFFMHLTPGKVLNLVIDLGESVIEATIEVVEQVLKALSWVLKELFGIDLMKILEWLGFLFDWEDILYTHNVLKDGANKFFDIAVAGAGELEDYVDRFCKYLENELSKIQPFPSDIGNSNQEGLEKHPDNAISASPFANVFEEITDFVSSSPVGNWAFSALNDILGGDNYKSPSWLDQLLEAFSEFGSDTINQEINNLETTIKQLGTDLNQIFNNNNLTANQIVAQIGGDILKSIIEAIRILVTNLVKVIAKVISAIKTGVNETINIPLLSPLYKFITHNDLSALDGMMLLFAIPTTIFYKIINGHEKAPFTKNSTAPLTLPNLANMKFQGTTQPNPSVDRLMAAAPTAAAAGSQPAMKFSVTSEENNEKDKPNEAQLTWSYVSVFTYMISSIGTTIVDILKYRGLKKLEGENQPLIGDKNKLKKELKTKAFIFNLCLKLPGFISAFPTSDTKASYPLQVGIFIFKVIQFLSDIVFWAGSTTEGENQEDWELGNIIVNKGISPLIILGAEIPIMILELVDAKDDQDKWDAGLKMTQHGIMTIAEILELIEEVKALKAKEADESDLFLIAGTIIVKAIAHGVNIVRMGWNIVEDEVHYNY